MLCLQLATIIFTGLLYVVFLRGWWRHRPEEVTRALAQHDRPVRMRVDSYILAVGASGLAVAVAEGAVSSGMAHWIQGPGTEWLGLVGLLALLPVFGVPRRVGRAWLWISCLGGPLMAFAIAEFAAGATSLPPQLAEGLRSGGVRSLLAPASAFAAFLWVGGPQRAGWSRAWTFLPHYVLWAHLLTVTMQSIAPGIILFVGFSLVPIVAARARDSDSWAGLSLRALPQFIYARAAVVWAGLLALVVDFGVIYLVSDDPETALVQRVMLPGDAPFLERWLAGFAASVVFGLGLAAAAYLVDRRLERLHPTPRDEPPPAVHPPDPSDPWSTPSAER